MTEMSARSTTVERVLGSDFGRRFFGDGPPAWRQGRSNRAAMTSEAARRKRLRDVKMLRRHGGDDEAVWQLADKLLACSAERRCRSAFCAECNRANQRLFVALASDLLGRSSAEVAVASVIAWDARVAQGQLARESQLFQRLSQTLRGALRAAGMRQAFGGFDVSANEHSNQGFAPHYRPHVWLFFPASQMDRVKKILRKFFPSSRIVQRPVRVQRFDGRTRGLAYALKADFVRRISLPRKVLSTGEVVRRNTRNRPLLARQKIELGLALDKIGLDARIFLHGLRLQESDGAVRIERIESAAPPRIEGRGSNGSASKPHGGPTARPSPSASVKRSKPARNPQFGRAPGRR